MAKHNGVTIRIGAAYDEVRVQGVNVDMTFDRADLNKRKASGDKEAKDALYQLRKGVVDAFVMQTELHNARKHKRAIRRQRKGYQHAA